MEPYSSWLCCVQDILEMERRAPYISMSGDEDLVFSMAMPVPLVDMEENNGER